MYTKMTKYIILIYDIPCLTSTKYHLDTSEFYEIPQFSSLYIFNIVNKLFGVCLVNYKVIDLQKLDKCNRGYVLQIKFVMWEHE